MSSSWSNNVITFVPIVQRSVYTDGTALLRLYTSSWLDHIDIYHISSSICTYGYDNFITQVIVYVGIGCSDKFTLTNTTMSSYENGRLEQVSAETVHVDHIYNQSVGICRTYNLTYSTSMLFHGSRHTSRQPCWEVWSTAPHDAQGVTLGLLRNLVIRPISNPSDNAVWVRLGPGWVCRGIAVFPIYYPHMFGFFMTSPEQKTFLLFSYLCNYL